MPLHLGVKLCREGVIWGIQGGRECACICADRGEDLA